METALFIEWMRSLILHHFQKMMCWLHTGFCFCFFFFYIVKTHFYSYQHIQFDTLLVEMFKQDFEFTIYCVKFIINVFKIISMECKTEI